MIMVGNESKCSEYLNAQYYFNDEKDKNAMYDRLGVSYKA